MSRILILLCIALLAVGCAEDNAQNIAQDMKTAYNDRHTSPNEEGHSLIVPEPSNKEQNKFRVHASNDVVTYADEFGFYLDTFYMRMKDLSSIFNDNNVNGQQLEQGRASLQELQQLSDEMLSMEVPSEFEGLHQIHMSALIELDALTMTLSDAVATNNTQEIDESMIYYENTVIALKQMEREYKIILEELGIK
ncbi:hypothetical protein [Desertibacillus haloalkaliphilus]|uniref:hypothetical protein n=1 Tax=Desertibacillus haloalkaliphilus TaxID=1328930 RepID=UPI001C274663|nr:hypothetical protein [Desertibacillus haloalkaliphilus]MBU8908049.1 hypothetical protein [Desertibacillus haloalkaliphilus]